MVTLYHIIILNLLQEYAVGSKVLLKVMKNHHRMGGKLDDRWTGPYEVVEKLSKGRYCLKTKEGKVLKKLYNGALLKDHLQPKGSNGMYIFY